MKRIIIDTNFLLIPFKFRVDIFSELNRICNFNYKLFIFDSTIDELKGIVNKQSNASELRSKRTSSHVSGKDKKAAQFALKLIKLKNIGIIKSKKGEVDMLLLNSINKDTITATLDLNLKKELLKKGASVVILRQKKYLQFIGGKLYK